MDKEMQVEQKFVGLIDGRNFVAFVEIEQHLGLSRCELIRRKCRLEDVLRLHVGEKLCLTTRVDLNPPGFEIGE